MPAENTHPGMFWLFFKPSGRLSRWPYFLALLFWVVLPGIAIGQMFAHQDEDLGLAFWTLMLLLTGLVGLLSILMLSIKRVHDIGYPAPLVILLFVPVASLFVFFWLLFWPSDGANAFGDISDAPP